MQRNHPGHRGSVLFVVITTFVVCTTLLYLCEVGNADAQLRVMKSHSTGVARFVVPMDSRPIMLKLAPGIRRAEPLDILRVYGKLFGVSDAKRQLVLKKTMSDRQRYTHTTYQQVHNGVPVFAGLMRVHMDEQNRLIAMNGTFIPDIAISVIPVLSAADAAALAVEDVADRFEKAIAIEAKNSKLYVFRTNLARGVPGTNHLVWEVKVANGNDIREFVYVDAHKGSVVDRISGIRESIHRRIYDQDFGDEFLVWEEGDSIPYGETDVDNLIDYSEDTYNLVASVTNGAFLSWDGADGIMHAVNNYLGISCPNANWNGTSTNYCPGVTADDIVGHEWGHAFTDSTHNLIYQWQPGALNESYSDIYGEVVDLLNGAGTDSPVPLRSVDECSTFGGGFPPDFVVNTPPEISGDYVVAGAEFNPVPPVSVTADVELANDGDDEGGAASVADACQPLVDFTVGNIALIDRGTCSFLDKAANAEAAGAVAVIIVNTLSNAVFQMQGDGSISIPAILIGQNSGNGIKEELPGVNATIVLQSSVDTSLRWLAGEDSTGFGGAIRDMWNPNCYRDPGKVTDTVQYFCGTGDHGGVHTNSGIPNHAFALLVDGGTFNGRMITAIGLTKAFHIYWRAQSVYQVPASDFSDHADAIEQSCADLTGVNLNALSTETPVGTPSGQVITSDDCIAVAEVIAAVELRTKPTHCDFTPLLDQNAPPLCDGGTSAQTIMFENWESGLGAWSIGTHSVSDPATFDTLDWAVVNDLPDGRSGSAAFVADMVIGDCADDTEAGVLYLESPVITIPSLPSAPGIAFNHWVATELGWDGGNVKINVNGGGWTLVPVESFTFNAYNRSLNFPDTGNDNPMAGEPAFTGTDGGSVTGMWGQSQIDLSGIAGLGDDIQLRFEFGLDGCNGVIGWYVDDVHVYACDVESEVTITAEPAWATPGDVGVKVDLCLDNSDYEVGGVQVDVCEDIDGSPVDCLTCVGCEMTERTVLFDCFVYELEGGCCRVILLSKNPGGVINPAVCSIVKIDYEFCDPVDPECPEECNAVDCIALTPENMVIADPHGNPLTVAGLAGEVCPFECGDVHPPESAPGEKDCGDGDVDLVDIITEVNFALGGETPDACQFIRADVPTGTPGYGDPPYCTPPDGTVDVLDIMVIIDMALDRQDCCTYYYTGGIF